MAELERNFHEIYEREYTYRLNTPVEIVGIHIVVTADIGKFEMSEVGLRDQETGIELKGRRKVDFAEEGIHDSNIYDGALLKPDMEFAGPAIIEDSGATTVIHPGNQVSIDRFGNIHINLEGV